MSEYSEIRILMNDSIDRDYMVQSLSRQGIYCKIVEEKKENQLLDSEYYVVFEINSKIKIV